MTLFLAIVALAVLSGLLWLGNRRYGRRASGPHHYSERRDQDTYWSSGYGPSGGEGGGGGGP